MVVKEGVAWDGPAPEPQTVTPGGELNSVPQFPPLTLRWHEHLSHSAAVPLMQFSV